MMTSAVMHFLPRALTRGMAAVPGWLRAAAEQPRTYLVLAGLMLAGLPLWAAVTDIDRVVRVEGRIVPAGRSQSIQHLEGGLVSRIVVGEGEAVRRGDLLVTIDPTVAGASLSETKARLDGLRLKAARLEAEIAGVDDISTLPDGIGAGSPLLVAERRLLTSRRAKARQQLVMAEEQMRQRRAELAELRSRHGQLVSELATARERTALLEKLQAQRSASQLEVLEARQAEQNVRTALTSAEGSMPKATAAIAEAEARLDQTRTSIEADARGELNGVLTEIDSLTNAEAAKQDRLERTEVRAPVDGIVNRLAVNTIGGVVKPGDTVVEITPTTGSVVLETRAHPRDRANMVTGQHAKVRVSAYDVGQLGTLDGRVTEISADTLPPAAGQQGEPYYRVVVQIDQLPEAYAGKLLAPGMTVDADVITGRRPLLSYLLSPLTKSSQRILRDAR